MPRLKDRNKQTPGGHQFYDPVLKYRPRPWASLDEIAQGLLQARLGNPGLTQQNAWSTDINVVTNEVDAAIAKHCQQMGWTDYVMADVPGGDQAQPSNFQQRPQNLRLLQKLKNVAEAPSVIVDFIKSKDEAVDKTLSTLRAKTCVECDYNEKSKSLLDIFTVSASEAIRKTLEVARGWNLKTEHDENLGVCDACHCPLKFKVHMPILHIRNKMPAEIHERLPEWCWIRKEIDWYK